MAAFIDAIRDPTWIRGIGMMFPFVSGAMWLYHYWVDFQIAIQVGAPNIFIIFHLFPVALGAVIYVRFLRLKSITSVFASSTIAVSFLMGISAISTDFTISGLLLIIVGTMVGVSISAGWQLITFAMPSVETRGRLFCFGHTGIALVLIAGLFISLMFPDGFGSFLFYSGIAVVVGVMAYRARDTIDQGLPKPTPIGAWSVAKDSIHLPAYLASLFQGFFFTAMYYAIFDFISPITGITRSFFILDLFLLIAFLAVPIGSAVDRFGRKVVVLIGVYVQGIALLLAAVLPSEMLIPETAYFVIIPLLAVGVLAGVFLAFLLFIELSPEFGKRSFYGITMTTFGFGMGLGLLTTTFLGNDPLTFPIFLLFLYFTFTLVVIQLKEPLPSKTEREWKKSIHELLVIGEGGLPLIQHRFQQGSIQVDSSLTSGALTGIDGLISEITKERGAVKIIKQERFCIMLEHGDGVTLALLADSESAVLRDKLQRFLAEFMAFFGNLVKEWSGNVVVFSPADRLIMKVFDS